jgi:hypothetical protein
MAKRAVDILTKEEEEEEGPELHIEIWVEHIFPNLYPKDATTTNGPWFWLQFGLVSKRFLHMMSFVRELRVDIASDGEIRTNRTTTIKTAFPNLVKLETTPIIGVSGILGFKHLKKLTLFSSPFYGTAIRLHQLSNITSLVVHDVLIYGIEHLENLEELSLLQINPYHQNMNLDGHKKIKRLRLGLACDNVCMNLTRFIPLQSELEYLECRQLYVFRDIKYTGIGKFRRDVDYYCCYEGEWVDGKRHGKGVFHLHLSVYKGVWENDQLKRGSVVYQDGSSYEGVFRDARYVDVVRGVLEYLFVRQGEGKMVDGDKIYEGEFVNGMRHGEGCLWEAGILTKKGRWEFDVFVE